MKREINMKGEKRKKRVVIKERVKIEFFFGKIKKNNIISKTPSTKNKVSGNDAKNLLMD